MLAIGWILTLIEARCSKQGTFSVNIHKLGDRVAMASVETGLFYLRTQSSRYVIRRYSKRELPGSSHLD
jgi:hypothetical protein